MTVLTKTKAFELKEFDHKKIVEAEREVEKLGPHDVLVGMKAASLNYRDYMVARGMYNPNFSLPLVPLSDGAGEVLEVGEAVKQFRPGDSVCSTFFRDWIAGEATPQAAGSALGGEIDGVLQAHKVFPEHGIVPAPKGLSFEQAATLPCAALTAWNALFEHGNVQPGDTVLVLGTGGVSIFALQFAHAAGATVIATSSSDQKLERVRKMGADHTINYKTTPSWEKKVLELTGGKGVDHIVEVGGAGTLEKSLKAIRLAGQISLIGVLAGAGDFDPIKILMKAVRMQGIFVGSREMFLRMNRAIETNRIEPVIDRTFKVEEVSEAIDHLKSGKHFGKVVLTF